MTSAVPLDIVRRPFGPMALWSFFPPVLLTRPATLFDDPLAPWPFGLPVSVRPLCTVSIQPIGPTAPLLHSAGPLRPREGKPCTSSPLTPWSFGSVNRRSVGSAVLRAPPHTPTRPHTHTHPHARLSFTSLLLAIHSAGFAGSIGCLQTVPLANMSPLRARPTNA